jgi:DNA (cytosine-5)-methyltransferase 1
MTQSTSILLIVDNFAGGGGASTGIEKALGRHVDIAINHDPIAIAMHRVNHPKTKHYCESVWDIDPVKACTGRPVGLAWFSPDCTHFSKAKGGKPVKKQIRGLAWVVLKWAATVRPKIIMLENVEEFVTWGPLIKKEDGNHYPCPKRKGQTFNAFINALKRHGYAVEYRELRACDYGAPTIRKRLFLIARCDGQPIVWPEPTHGDPKSEAVKSGRLKPWRTAAECIFWSVPCPSIFERKKPLAEATQRRIAKGIMKYVINTDDPFIVTYYGAKGPEDFRGQPINESIRTQTTENRHAVVTPFIARTDMHKSNAGCAYDINDPLRTITSGGGHALISSTLIQTGYGERKGQSPRVPGLDKPIGTIVASGTKHALVSAFLAKHYGNGVVGSELKDPIGTVTSIDHHSLIVAHITSHFGQGTGSYLHLPARTITSKGKYSLITSHIVKMKGTNIGHDVRDPLHTITAGGTHHGEVRTFFEKYYGSEKQDIGLITIHGEEYQIVDIGLRMLTPRELFRAQGFSDSYIIDHDVYGKPITKTEQVAKCGNSVPPNLAEALVRANAAGVFDISIPSADKERVAS